MVNCPVIDLYVYDSLLLICIGGDQFTVSTKGLFSALCQHIQNIEGNKFYNFQRNYGKIKFVVAVLFLKK